MYHLALGIEYLGTKFSGAQAQEKQRTVQRELESAISQVAADKIQIAMSSRTDSGVHATNQIIGFQSDSFRPNSNWLNGINTYLPEDVAVHCVVRVSPTFDPRRSSRWRRYLYIFGECDHIPAIGRELAYWVTPGMNTTTMDLQARVLLGEHDFSSFRGAQCQSRSPRRSVHSISVVRVGAFIVIDIIANAFLLRMVRNIAGTLLEIGRGSNLELRDLLSSKDRSQAPATAPPVGLYLVQISYHDYPELSKLRIPRVLGANSKLHSWETDNFVAVRELIETQASSSS